MANYDKINTLFKRDEKTNHIIVGEYTFSFFKLLENIKWECTEKIDGTNIHIDVDWRSENEWDISYHGRTERADIPRHLLAKLHEMFDNFNPNSIFTYEEPVRIEIFGEGYGAKIQKGGNYISNGVGFILFDIRIKNMWLLRKNLEDIANRMGIEIVPLVGYMTLREAIDYVQKGFVSNISENREYKAEGLVLKTPEGLLDRRGNRIISKLKTIDFEKLRNK